MNSNSRSIGNEIHPPKKDYYPQKQNNYYDNKHQYYPGQNIKGYSSTNYEHDHDHNSYKQYYHSNNYNSSMDKYDKYNNYTSAPVTNKISLHILLSKSHFNIIDKNLEYLKSILKKNVKDIYDIRHDYTVNYYDDYVLKISVYTVKSKAKCIYFVSDFLYKEYEKIYNKMSYIKISILIADSVIGNIIGLEGKNINNIREQTNTKIEVFSEIPKAKYRKIEIVGEPFSISEACEKIFSIEEKYINFYYGFDSSGHTINKGASGKGEMYYNNLRKPIRSRSRNRSRSRSRSYEKKYEKPYDKADKPYGNRYDTKRHISSTLNNNNSNNNYRYKNNSASSNKIKNYSNDEANNGNNGNINLNSNLDGNLNNLNNMNKNVNENKEVIEKEEKQEVTNSNVKQDDQNNLNNNAQGANEIDKENLDSKKIDNEPSQQIKDSITQKNQIESAENIDNTAEYNIINNDNIQADDIKAKEENYKIDLLFSSDIIFKLKLKEENILNQIKEKFNCDINETDCKINDENMKIISFNGIPENNSKAIYELQTAIISFIEN